jgi:hypothetical protein
LPDTLDKRPEWETSSFFELRQREAVPGIAWRNPRLPETPTASVSPLKRMARNETVSPFLSTPTRWTWRFCAPLAPATDERAPVDHAALQ